MISDHYDIVPAVGKYIKPDGWRIGSILTRGDDFSTFRLPTHNGVITSVACEIEVTGRTPQRLPWYDCLFVRVKITFPGDGEPDTVTRGFMKIN